MVLSSTDRVLMGIQVRQETKTGFLNLSDLQAAYDTVRVGMGWDDRRIDRIMSTDTFKERAFYVIAEENPQALAEFMGLQPSDNQHFITTQIGGVMERIDNQGITSFLKELGMWRTAGARNTKTAWCNPYIWVLIAMEMNPYMYAKVVKWVSDTLIFNRIEAGNLYKTLTQQIARLSDKPNYAAIAIALNRKVFGRHEAGIRQLVSKDELKRLSKIEQELALFIENDFITSEQQLMDFIDKRKY
jgi:hypothetical protein